MGELIETLAVAALNLALPYAVTRWDRQRLRGLERARAWNAASWASALFFFGPLCLPAHFWITRRSALAALVGMVCTTAIIGFELGCSWALERCF